MVVDNEQVDINVVYKHILSLQEEVDRKFAELSKQLLELTTHMIESKTLEKDRNIASKLDEERKRIDAIERREERFQGQLTMLKWIGALMSFIVTALTGWQIIKALSGK